MSLKERRPTGALLTVRTASVEPLAVHFGVVAVAIMVGLGLLEGLQALESALWADTVGLSAYVPLFPPAMLGGVLVQLVVGRLDGTGGSSTGRWCSASRASPSTC